MLKFSPTIIIILAIYLLSAYSKSIYDTNKSYITPITTINFKKQLVKIRETTNYVSIVHYYK